jgi:hypothetical protein
LVGKLIPSFRSSAMGEIEHGKSGQKKNPAILPEGTREA